MINVIPTILGRKSNLYRKPPSTTPLCFGAETIRVKVPAIIRFPNLLQVVASSDGYFGVSRYGYPAKYCQYEFAKLDKACRAMQQSLTPNTLRDVLHAELLTVHALIAFSSKLGLNPEITTLGRLFAKTMAKFRTAEKQFASVAGENLVPDASYIRLIPEQVFPIQLITEAIKQNPKLNRINLPNGDVFNIEEMKEMLTEAANPTISLNRIAQILNAVLIAF